ncbi:putative sporulation protein YtxC [Halalkalibacter oceani]|uniref:Sporulation protein YtxC n=1 Tax=Halalkalibacter oceani TaxID=1653776 RepID=A0A9X2IPG2_9BACI|nr:putative sporulation protein YtxC [Halalkalibacter oceani]MCM3715999.1 putative sporulation protein YtxC [Halalkalibacter oceani]
MIAIHFEQTDDCKQLLDQLRTYIRNYAAYGLEGTVKREGETTILLNYENQFVNFYDSFHPLLVSVLTDYVISTKEEEWLLDIVETMFYFTAKEEQQEIITIARAILEGDRDDLPMMKTFFNRRAYIYEAFANHVEEETSFFYEPFLTFRLREYGEMLIDCVEMAIDEYMLEQEYQNMIADLRHYVKSHQPKFSCLHIVHDQGFTLYDEHFRRLTREELLFHLNVELMFEEALEVEEMVVSPLVSLLPGRVYLFTDEPDDGVILTLQAIFEERLRLYPLRAYEPESTNF